MRGLILGRILEGQARRAAGPGGVKKEVVLGIEPRLKDLESSVLTVTPYHLSWVPSALLPLNWPVAPGAASGSCPRQGPLSVRRWHLQVNIDRNVN